MKRFGLPLLAVVVAMMSSLACSKLSPSKADDLVRLPDNMNNASADPRIGAQTSIVINVDAGAKTYFGKEPVVRERLTELIKQKLIDRSTDEKIVYLKGDATASFTDIVDVLKAIRSADIDRVALVVKSAKSSDILSRFEVRLPASKNLEKTSDGKVRVESMTVASNPYLLNVTVSGDRKLRLNNEDEGTLDNTDTLRAKVAEVIRQREQLGDTLPDTKTVMVYAARTLPYRDVAKIIDAVAGAGAIPIGLQLDDEAPRPTPSVQPLAPQVIEGGVPVATPK